MPPSFERSVFVNCPFDDDSASILQAIAFCITDLGFYPRLAPDNADNSANRLDRILELVRGSKYGIHDLSRCKSTTPDGYAQMLGRDWCLTLGDNDISLHARLDDVEIAARYRRNLTDVGRIRTWHLKLVR